MADKWFAECLPCKWEETYDTEDSAITAAEEHVYANHRNVPPHIRGEKKMGHVQNRTVGALASQLPPTPAPQPLGQGSSESTTSSSSSQTPEQSNVVTITMPEGETITVKE